MKKCRTIVALCLAVLMVLSIFPVVSATPHPQMPWVLTGNRWPNGSNIVFIAHSGFSDVSMSHFNEALWQYNSRMGRTNITRSATQRHSFTGWNFSLLPDGHNLIFREDIGPARGMLGATRTFSRQDNRGVTIEADILINTYYPWHNNPSPTSNAFDTWSVFLHEAGHVIGLADVFFTPNPVMHYTINRGVQRRWLTNQDLNGVFALNYQ